MTRGKITLHIFFEGIHSDRSIHLRICFLGSWIWDCFCPACRASNKCFFWSFTIAQLLPTFCCLFTAQSTQPLRSYRNVFRNILQSAIHGAERIISVAWKRAYFVQNSTTLLGVWQIDLRQCGYLGMWLTLAVAILRTEGPHRTVIRTTSQNEW